MPWKQGKAGVRLNDGTALSRGFLRELRPGQMMTVLWGQGLFEHLIPTKVWEQVLSPLGRVLSLLFKLYLEVSRM